MKLDGKYTKLLKAFADTCNLKHNITLDETGVFPSLVVEVLVETRQFQSILDIFEYGKIAYISSMRRYTYDIQEDTVEYFSKQIIDELCKPNRYIQSIKGGNELMIMPNGHLEKVEKYTYKCPRSIEELMIKIDLAGINIDDIHISLCHLFV